MTERLVPALLGTGSTQGWVTGDQCPGDGLCDKDLVALGPALSGDRFPHKAAAPSLTSLTKLHFPQQLINIQKLSSHHEPGRG